MHHSVLSQAAGVKDSCQICGAELKIIEVEPHPKHGEWEIHGFSCGNCGPVKSLVVRRSFRRPQQNKVRDIDR